MIEHVPALSADTVRRATHRDWAEWFAVIDAWGAGTRAHGEIVTWLRSEHGVDNWWGQTVTVEYERARGMRAIGSGRDGRFRITASKTIAAPVGRVYAAVTNPVLRARWLPGVALRERTSQPDRSVRFDFGGDGTRVNVGFVAKGADRCLVGLQHDRLVDAEAAATSKVYWRERLTALASLLSG